MQQTPGSFVGRRAASYDNAAMAIRFQCPSCSQPIEVDDELAQRLVACPYCRKTITAPAQSTLPDPERLPLASPLGSSMVPHGPPFPRQQSPLYTPAESKNALAVVAFALACSLLGWFMLLGIIAGQHRIELEEMEKAMAEAGSLTEQWQVTMEFIEQRGGQMPAWLIVMGLGQLAAIATWIGASICGIIAMRRVARRGFATAALAICALAVFLICLLP